MSLLLESVDALLLEDGGYLLFETDEPLTVTDLTAFYVIAQRDKFVMLAVGNVPAGTACDETQPVVGHYVVPRDTVTWAGTVQPEVVVAKCS